MGLLKIQDEYTSINSIDPLDLRHDPWDIFVAHRDETLCFDGIQL